MRARTRRLGCWVVLASALLSASCGSTLPGDEQANLEANAVGSGSRAAASEEGGGFATADPAAGTDASGAPADAAVAAGTPGAARAASNTRAGSVATGSAAAPGGTAARSAAGATDADGPSAPGVSDTEVKIGLVYDVNQGATNAALGVAPAIGQIDTRRAYDAMIGSSDQPGD